MSPIDHLPLIDPDAGSWQELSRELGTIRRVSAVGIGGRTLLIDTAEQRFVLKRFASDRCPNDYGRLMSELWREPRPYCPEVLGMYRGPGSAWYAAFAWVDADESSAPARAALWPAALELLTRMRRHEGATPWPLDRSWLDRLEAPLQDEPAATSVLAWLRGSPLFGASTLAHGDFGAQNLVLGSDGRFRLVDWEEVGSAPPGFDAGWMLALARLGVDVGPEPREMARAFCAIQVPPSNLLWFERLATLRLLFRAKTLPLAPTVRERLLPAVRCAVAEHGAQLARS